MISISLFVGFSNLNSIFLGIRDNSCVLSWNTKLKPSLKFKVKAESRNLSFLKLASLRQLSNLCIYKYKQNYICKAGTFQTLIAVTSMTSPHFLTFTLNLPHSSFSLELKVDMWRCHFLSPDFVILQSSPTWALFFFNSSLALLQLKFSNTFENIVQNDVQSFLVISIFWKRFLEWGTDCSAKNSETLDCK